MAEIDIRIKLIMIEYLVGGISDDQKSLLISVLRNVNFKEEQREALVKYLIDNINHHELCSKLELVSFFHQTKEFSLSFIREVTKKEIADLPCFIIAFNQLTYLQSIVNFFLKIGATNVHIIDNNSSYQPLIDYLTTVPFTVHTMKKNYGHMVLFDNPAFEDIINNNYFVLSDPDVLPVEECPDDFMTFFFDILLRHPTKNKVGFSLKINDLPSCYKLRSNVIAHQSRFYKNETLYKGVKIYDAAIDTTFALYRPRREWWRTGDFYAAFRVASPYAARHLPWYRDLSRPTDEELFYRETDASSSNWNGTMSSEELHGKYGTAEDPDYAAVVTKALKLFIFVLRAKRLLLWPFKAERRRIRRQLKTAKTILRSRRSGCNTEPFFD